MNGGKKTIGVLFQEAWSFIFNKANIGPLAALSGVLLGASMIIGSIIYVVDLFLTMPLSMIGFLPILPLLGGLGFSEWSYEFGEPSYGGPSFDGPSYNFDPALLGGFIASILVVVAAVAVVILIVMVFSVAMGILLNTIGVSTQEGSLRMVQGRKIKAGELMNSFGRNWKRYLGISAWSALWVFLWALLFYVPGIIKSFSYCLAPYLVIEYPELTVKQALRKSMEITHGYKGRLFLIALIVAGLYVASSLLFCTVVGPLAAMVLVVLPLSLVMYALAYQDIRNAAIERGLLPPAGAPDANPPEQGKPETAEKTEQPAHVEPLTPVESAPDSEPVPDENGDVPMAAGSGGGVEGQFVDLEEDSPQL